MSRPRPGGAPGQALVEFAVTGGCLLLLFVLAWTLTPRSLLPIWMDERLALVVRAPGGEEDLRLLGESKKGGALVPPGGDGHSVTETRETPSSRFRLSVPRGVYPGVDREARMSATIGPHLSTSSLESSMAVAHGATGCERRMRMASLRSIPPGEVQRMVEQGFLGGLADRAGILDPLKRLGLNPVRVNLDALPRDGR